MPVESQTHKRARAAEIIRLLRIAYPDAQTSLKYRSVHQLLVSTILSAQCTDERVNMVTPGLFKKYPTVKAFAEADLKELQKDIYTTGFYKNKARAIRESARQLLERHGGKVPKTLDQLVAMTGVGRKTGSVVLGAGYGLAEGVVVDTHVSRISRLLGFTRHRDAVKIERDLMKIIDKDDWIVFSHLLILHGRAVCIARRPDCPNCPISKLCLSATPGS